MILAHWGHRGICLRTQAKALDLHAHRLRAGFRGQQLPQAAGETVVPIDQDAIEFPPPRVAEEIEHQRGRGGDRDVSRLGAPEEIAGLIIYLCSDEAAFVTGANVSMNGGQHMQ